MFFTKPRNIISSFLLLLMGMLVLGCQAPASAPLPPTPAMKGLVASYAVDGDTLQLAERRIRLMGIDAPEMGQTCQDANGAPWFCGRQARDHLALLMQGGITCETTSHDRYGRELARCINAGGQDIAAEMTRQGWAVAYIRYSRAYEPEEQAARNAKAGIWAGRFERPEEYRRRLRG